MIKVIRPSLNTKEKSVELKLFNGISTLHIIVCSYTRSTALDARPVQIRNSDTTVKFLQLFWCCCCYVLIFLMLLLFFADLFLNLHYSMGLLHLVLKRFIYGICCCFHVFYPNRKILILNIIPGGNTEIFGGAVVV